MCGGHLQRGVGSLVRDHPCGGGPDPYYLKVSYPFDLRLYDA
jgi:hypothetical protein